MNTGWPKNLKPKFMGSRFRGNDNLGTILPSTGDDMPSTLRKVDAVTYYASLMAGEGPMDAFSAQGHNGQFILVVPSKAAVVVRLGLMDDGSAAWKALGQWLTPIVNAMQDVKG